MHPITLRIPNDLLSELESEAEELGYSSRAEYIRQLLQNRAHTRKALSTDDANKIVDPETIEANTEQIEDMAVKISELMGRVENIETKIDNQSSDTEHSEAGPASEDRSGVDPTSTVTLDPSSGSEPSSTIANLENWIEEYGPQSTDAVTIILEAATILNEEGPLSTGEIKERLYDKYPDAYSSENALWGSTIERIYEDAPGFTKLKYGTYDFEDNQE